MKSEVAIKPKNGESPVSYADRLGIYYSLSKTQSHKKENGQFFTPAQIAYLMASFCTSTKTTVRILDPGCGTTILSCALAEQLVLSSETIREIELVAYETDPSLIQYSNAALSYLKTWLFDHGVELKYYLENEDFVLANSHVLFNNFNCELFDFIISNPPYFKLKADDPRTLAVSELVSGQPNIYSFFMGLASMLLAKNGILVFITPRSFASGNYFSAFRNHFFYNTHLERIHLFNSRKDTFNRDKVLQETVIIKAVVGKTVPKNKVVISSSAGLNDIPDSVFNEFCTDELINMNSEDKILHLPTSDDEIRIMSLVGTWKNTLTDFNIYISTGPVVSFRATEYILNSEITPAEAFAPLFWLHNVNKMSLEWPRFVKEKGQYLITKNAPKPLLLPNKNYIFLRRFSTKDDKSRLIAAPYFCNHTTADYIGVENKVNYIYRKKGHIDRDETVGLCALLNSELFDTYFQIFNGNVNVSATELRNMKFPPINDIKSIGNQIILSNDYSMENVNKIVNSLFTWKNTKNEQN